MVLNLVLFVLAVVNNFVHARDGWTSVVPTGLTLSAVMVLIMIVSGFLGHRMAYAHVAHDARHADRRDERPDGRTIREDRP